MVVGVRDVQRLTMERDAGGAIEPGLQSVDESRDSVTSDMGHHHATAAAMAPRTVDASERADEHAVVTGVGHRDQVAVDGDFGRIA